MVKILGLTSCSIAIVVPEHPARAFPALDLSHFSSDFDARIYDPVIQTLVVAFPLLTHDAMRGKISYYSTRKKIKGAERS